MHRRPTLRHLLACAVAAALLALGAVGCTTHDTGGALDFGGGVASRGGATTGSTQPATGSGPGKPCRQAEQPESKGAPVVPMPPTAPSELSISDLTTGSGAAAQTGSIVTVAYVGVSCSTGHRFDSTWERHQPYTLTLAAASNLLPGWLAGLQGMKVGGRRLLVIPPAEGYGNNPPKDSGIAAGETLVYVVDLLAVK